LIAGVLALWYRSPGSGELATGDLAVPAALREPLAERHDKQVDKGASEVVPTVDSNPTVRQRFRDATDYAAFIDSILSNARAGDRDAQYYVYAALAFCDMEFRTLFKRRSGAGWLTRDEALNRTAGKFGYNLSWTEAVDQKCRALMEGGRSELGDSRIWLEDAATQGQPIAMAALANLRLVDMAVGKPDGATAAGAAELLMSALKSKDPEVMWTIGLAQGFLKPDSEDSLKAQWAWWLVACERGYECGEQSLFQEFTCRYEQCPPGETVVDHMKRLLQTDYAAVEELAREIDGNIESGNWSELEKSISGKS
jgi:hypothetical protein